MPRPRGDRLDRPVERLARVAERAPEVVRLVDDEQIDARLERAFGQLGTFDEQLVAEHDPPVRLEGVHLRAEVALDIREALGVEQDEDLVILAPELPEPLDRQRLRRDDDDALRPARPDQAARDQAGLDGLPQPNLVGEQPTHRVLPRRLLGDVELVREEPDAPSEEGAESVRLADPREVQRVEAVREVLEAVDLAARQALREPLALGDRPELLGRHLAGFRTPHRVRTLLEQP